MGSRIPLQSVMLRYQVAEGVEMGAEIGLVIFDFDGTLANSEPGITWVIEQVIAELDLPPTAVAANRAGDR